MTIERTELANRAFDAVVRQRHPMSALAEQMIEAISRGDEAEVARIKTVLRSTQSWRRS